MHCAACLPKLKSFQMSALPVTSEDTQFFDFTGSFTTGILFLKQANCQLCVNSGYFLIASLAFLVREKKLQLSRLKSQAAYRKAAG